MNPEFWNSKFSANKRSLYGEEPNAFFKAQIDKMKPGKLLVPACGQGRDALYAAKKGFDVTAVDYSYTAVKHTKERALQNNLNIKVLHADLRNLILPANHFNAAALIFAHFPPQFRNEVHSKLIEALKPGGNVILQGFAKEQSGKKSGGPKDVNMLFNEDLLREDFITLKDLEIKTLTETLNEGTGHRGLAHLIQLTGKKGV